MTSSQVIKINSISEEIEGAYELIWAGLKQINNPKLFHLNNSVPLHLFSFGFERFIKTLILMYRSNDEKQFPIHDRPKDAFKRGHSLSVLLKELITKMEHESLITDFPYTRNELNELKENKKFWDFISIIEDYGQFQRFHYLNTLVTEAPVYSDDNNPYLRFLRFHWEFLPDGNFDPTIAEKIEAQKMFSFVLIDFTRILSRNLYNGIGRKFPGQIHDFSIFMMKSNEEVFQQLKVDN
jgi:hypothetical protein